MRRAEECLRISQLRMFSEYLCGIDPPLLAYNLDTNAYESLVHPQGRLSLALHYYQNCILQTPVIGLLNNLFELFLIKKKILSIKK